MSRASADPYKTLGLKEEASPEEIKLAFRKLARKYHPDVSHHPNAEERFKAINAAYRILGDPVVRSRHDQWRQSARQPADTMTYDADWYRRYYRMNPEPEFQFMTPDVNLGWRGFVLIIAVVLALLQIERHWRHDPGPNPFPQGQETAVTHTPEATHPAPKEAR